MEKVKNKYMKPDAVKEAREAFFAHDLDGSGEIEMGEFKKVLEQIGVKFTSDQWEGVLKEVAEACDDGKHDDKVTFDEAKMHGQGPLRWMAHIVLCVRWQFLHFYRKFLGSDEDKKKLKKKVNKKLNKVEYDEAHKQFCEVPCALSSIRMTHPVRWQLDKDNSGTLDKAELRPLLDRLQVSLSTEQYDALVEHVLKTADGQDGGASDGVLDFTEFLYFYKRCLRSSDAVKKWEEKVQLRYNGPNADQMNYEMGL